MVKSSLLRLVRGELSEVSKEKQLDLLLKEQETLTRAKERGDQVVIQFIKDNIQEMSSNPVPLPPTVSDESCFHIYGKVLERKITHYQSIFGQRPIMVEESTQERQANPIGVDTTDSDSSDDGDLRSFLTVQTRVVAPGSQAAQEEQKEAQT